MMIAPEVPEAADPVRRALSPNTLRVYHESRPCDFLEEFAKWAITHCLVYNDAEQFLGVVELRSLVGHAVTRAFGELLPPRGPPAIAVTASLAELCARFRNSNASCLLAYDGHRLCGLVTRESFLEFLLQDNHPELSEVAGVTEYQS